MSNTPTTTLAAALKTYSSWFTAPIELTATITESAARLLSQQDTIAKQDERIVALQWELAEMAENYREASNMAHLRKLKADQFSQQLEQERQDRKQADLDTVRALGERNDARKELAAERALADRLANQLDGCAELTAAHEALAAWKEARRE